MESEGLQFRTDLLDQVVHSRSVTQRMMIFRGKLLKKPFNKRLKLEVVPAMQVSIWLSDRHYFSFVAILAANFGCCRFRVEPEIVSNL